jgi:hypothetical protein
MSEMIRGDLGGGKVMNRKGVVSEESAIERKDDESLFFLSRFLLDLCCKKLHDHVWNRVKQAFLDGYSSILDSV